MEKVMLTTQEIEELRTIKNEYDRKIFEFGKLKQSRILVERQIKELNDFENDLVSEYFSIQERERKIAEELEKKHGIGRIDLETGEFFKEKQ